MVALGIAALEVVPAALAQVLYPRMAQEYGAGRDTRHLVRISVKPMLATSAGLAVVAAVGWFAVEPAVQFLIPEYVGAVPAMQWALLLPGGEQLPAGGVRLQRGRPAGHVPGCRRLRRSPPTSSPSWCSGLRHADLDGLPPGDAGRAHGVHDRGVPARLRLQRGDAVRAAASVTACGAIRSGGWTLAPAAPCREDRT